MPTLTANDRKTLDNLVRAYSLPDVLRALIAVNDGMRGAFPDDSDYQSESSRREHILRAAITDVVEGSVMRLVTDGVWKP